MTIYSKINEFCSVRNLGNCYKNGTEPTPRVRYLINLLEKEGIEYELDIFSETEIGQKPIYHFYDEDKYFDVDYRDFDDEYFRIFRKRRFKSNLIKRPKNNFFNIILKGSSKRMVVAHHDIQNPNIDNANDNSASVINAISLKKLRPNLNVVLLDGEEMGGIGSTRLSKQIKNGDFGQIEWVLNLELTGKGGRYFFIGNYPGPLYERIKKIFNCPVVNTPFNDSVIIRNYNIDSCVINSLPPLPEGEKSSIKFDDSTYLDYRYLYHCHNEKDNLNSISVNDMKEFTEEVVLKIID
jgi:hypothetical protein